MHPAHDKGQSSDGSIAERFGDGCANVIRKFGRPTDLLDEILEAPRAHHLANVLVLPLGQVGTCPLHDFGTRGELCGQGGVGGHRIDHKVDQATELRLLFEEDALYNREKRD